MNQPRDAYHGFDLRSVCWGYREIFSQAIEQLFADGLLGSGQEAVTAAFFEQLSHADHGCYDHVLKEFLAALNPRTRWLLELPGIFTELTALGHRFAEARLFYGIHFFKTMGDGGFGESPAQVRQLVTLAKQLFAVDASLADALLTGYRTLLERLQPREIDLYVQEALRLYHRSSEAGRTFLACTSKASETIIQSITHECRLPDMEGQLTGLLRALTGCEVEVAALSELDADELVERGSRVICLYRWLYLPVRVRYHESADRNQKWYLLATIAAASMLAEKTFCSVHGHLEIPEPEALVGSSPGRLNLFVVLEYVRGLKRAEARWPGCQSLIRWGLLAEFQAHPPRHLAEELLHDAMLLPAPRADAHTLCQIAGRLCNVFDTVEELDANWAQPLIVRLGKGGCLVRAFSFLPDFFYPAQVKSPPPDRMVADMKEQVRKRRAQDSPDNTDRPPLKVPEPDPANASQDDTDTDAAPACYWYPEWNIHENAYLDPWCGVHELATPLRATGDLPPDIQELARRVRTVFERLRPTEIRREKRLESGDSMDMDRLVTHRIHRRLEPDPYVDFYEKPLTSRRDLAVLILLDVSGSTGTDLGQRKVLDVEKHAAVVLGQGLDLLGDQFAVTGFSSNGREQCEYYRYKSFEDSWDQAAVQRILSAHPRSSTRIGPALRHSAWLLRKVEARQRLIILVTDGQPMDSGYSPHTRYAQHDVRMACEENDRAGIATLGISTDENSLADLEIMFPRRRFAVLPEITALPTILPNLYLRMTS